MSNKFPIPKKLRIHTRFSTAQSALLEDFFHHTPYPSLEQFGEIAVNGFIRRDTIVAMIWFQNKRATLQRTSRRKFTSSITHQDRTVSSLDYVRVAPSEELRLPLPHSTARFSLLDYVATREEYRLASLHNTSMSSSLDWVATREEIPLASMSVNARRLPSLDYAAPRKEFRRTPHNHYQQTPHQHTTTPSADKLWGHSLSPPPPHSPSPSHHRSPDLAKQVMMWVSEVEEPAGPRSSPVYPREGDLLPDGEMLCAASILCSLRHRSS
ncbi:hypothetical protein BDN72DRAFT_862139 [Pluteus cervinus]|uniref:Uncharacterized protein n=1 Tax=Pluteus cervinus TaxID=181527 RepID=A0ACD3ACB6_9AGAR|nr:hypothetical protein BDN72DRAFT_862139 [Pluteus cervinus]